MKILIADDDDTALAVARKILERDSHEALTAEDGQAALEMLVNSDIQVVISDWNMPRLSGLELCQKIRAMPFVGYIYFIMVTSRSSKSDLLEGLEAGADDFIAKPFEPAELLLRVRNARRLLALESTAVTLFSLAKLAESKDGDTARHLERIRAYALVLGEYLLKLPALQARLPVQFAELLYQTSPLHDIGKVGIPDHVLLKPGSLNDEEWLIMKRHAEIGAQTLDAALQVYPAAEYLRMARDIAWAHHEHWDGRGYPRGLKGEEIPFSARVVALADVYDALTMKRVYKSIVPHDVARGIILAASGKQFDPQVVEAFRATEAQFIQIHDTFPDD